jgi:hypothetical protein
MSFIVYLIVFSKSAFKLIRLTSKFSLLCWSFWRISLVKMSNWSALLVRTLESFSNLSISPYWKSRRILCSSNLAFIWDSICETRSLFSANWFAISSKTNGRGPLTSQTYSNFVTLSSKVCARSLVHSHLSSFLAEFFNHRSNQFMYHFPAAHLKGE